MGQLRIWNGRSEMPPFVSSGVQDAELIQGFLTSRMACIWLRSDSSTETVNVGIAALRHKLLRPETFKVRSKIDTGNIFCRSHFKP